MTTFKQQVTTFFSKVLVGDVSFNTNKQNFTLDTQNLTVANQKLSDFLAATGDKTILISVLTKNEANQNELLAFGQQLKQNYLISTWYTYLLQSKIADLTIFNLVIANHQQPLFIRPGVDLAFTLNKFDLQAAHIFPESEFDKYEYYHPAYKATRINLVIELCKLSYLLEPQKHLVVYQKQIHNLTTKDVTKKVTKVLNSAYQKTINDLKTETIMVVSMLVLNKFSAQALDKNQIKSIYLLDLNTVFQKLQPHEKTISNLKEQNLSEIVAALKKSQATD